VDYTGVVVGGVIGLIGSCIAAIVAILIAKANIDAAEVRHHEEVGGGIGTIGLDAMVTYSIDLGQVLPGW